MSAAKITSLLGSVVYLAIFLGGIIFPHNIRDLITQVVQINLKTALAVLLAGAFLTSVINFSYFYYLNYVQKNGDKLNSAVFYSFQLLILPLMVIGGLLLFLVSTSK
jgi:hypothetical protein